MAETAGEPLKKLAERQRDDRDYPIVYVDGIRFCGHHILATLCVDDEGNKRILEPGRARLFVLDGSKALRKAVGQVFGSSCLVERCRNHKMRNVTGHLPKALHDQARAVLQAAWKLGAKDGRSSSSRLDGEAASRRRGSLREGLEEMIAGSEIGLTSALRRCLGHGRPHRRRPLGKAPPHRPGDPVERPGSMAVR